MTDIEGGDDYESTADEGLHDGRYEAELTDDTYGIEDQEGIDTSYDRSEYAAELEDESYDAVFNDKGEKIEAPPTVENEKFLDSSGKVEWKEYGKNSDSNGFDTRYPVESYTMEPGMVISRYGSERGRFASDPGTKYDALSLPNKEDSVEYHEYRVVAPITCQKGVVAANFERNGQGTQYMFRSSIARMEREGLIVEVKR